MPVDFDSALLITNFCVAEQIHGSNICKATKAKMLLQVRVGGVGPQTYLRPSEIELLHERSVKIYHLCHDPLQLEASRTTEL